MKKKLIFIGVLAAVLVMFFLAPKIVYYIVNISIDPKNIVLCKVEERARNERLNGVISEKFRDNKNHNYETLKIEYMDSTYLSNILVLDNSGLFEYIKKGDSISKEKGGLDFYVSRNGFTNLFELSYDCKK